MTPEQYKAALKQTLTPEPFKTRAEKLSESKAGFGKDPFNLNFRKKK